MIDGFSAFARHLVDLVDVDDALLGPLDVVVGGLDQLEEDVLDILADVAGLGEGGGVGDGDRDVQLAGEGLDQEGLARTGGADHQDVRFGEFDVVVPGLAGAHPLVVVVHSDGEGLLGRLLAYHVLVQIGADLDGLGELGETDLLRGRQFLLDDLVAEIDALVADVDARDRRSIS